MKRLYLLLSQGVHKIGHELNPYYNRYNKLKNQTIFNLTVKKLCFVQNSAHQHIMSAGKIELTLVSKCHESSGRSQYKQKFINEKSNNVFLFKFSFLLLKMYPRVCA